MYRSKFITLYKTLTPIEHRALKKWLKSPLHNKHKEVQQLFNFIATRYNLNETTLEKERVWKQLYPNQPYNDLRLRHLLSISLDILNNFVRFFLSKSDHFQQEKILVKRYCDEKIHKSARQQLKKAAATLEKLPWNEQYYYHQYELETLTFEIEGTENRTRTTNIMEITTHARLFFMLTTLRYAYIAL